MLVSLRLVIFGIIKFLATPTYNIINVKLFPGARARKSAFSSLSLFFFSSFFFILSFGSFLSFSSFSFFSFSFSSFFVHPVPFCYNGSNANFGHAWNYIYLIEIGAFLIKGVLISVVIFKCKD